MRERDNVFPVLGALAALGLLLPVTAFADDPVDPSRQLGEDRWVPSLSITSGLLFQELDGFVDSWIFEDVDGANTMSSLRGRVDDDDLGVSPFVGGTLELMSPALPIAGRPRFFASGGILPTFASDHNVANEGAPGCIKGPEANAICGKDEPDDPPTRGQAFGEMAAIGKGTITSATLDLLVFGADVGVAFPVKWGERQLRIKPSVGWINYEVEAEGLVSDVRCFPTSRCTDLPDQIFQIPGFPPIIIPRPGFMREMNLRGNDSKRFNGIGPGLDLEVDTVRYGPIGVSLFMGVRVYYVPGDRKISFGTTVEYDDAAGHDIAHARWEVEVDPWMYRGHAGIRFQWLGGVD